MSTGRSPGFDATGLSANECREALALVDAAAGVMTAEWHLSVARREIAVAQERFRLASDDFARAEDRLGRLRRKVSRNVQVAVDLGGAV